MANAQEALACPPGPLAMRKGQNPHFLGSKLHCPLHGRDRPHEPFTRNPCVPDWGASKGPHTQPSQGTDLGELATPMYIS